MAQGEYEAWFVKMRKEFERAFSPLYTTVRMAGWEWEADETLDELLDEMQDQLHEFDAGEDEEEA